MSPVPSYGRARLRSMRTRRPAVIWGSRARTAGFGEAGEAGGLGGAGALGVMAAASVVSALPTAPAERPRPLAISPGVCGPGRAGGQPLGNLAAKLAVAELARRGGEEPKMGQNPLLRPLQQGQERHVGLRRPERSATQSPAPGTLRRARHTRPARTMPAVRGTAPVRRPATRFPRPMGDLVPRHPHRDHPPGDHRADCGRPHRRSTPPHPSCTPPATPPPRRPSQDGTLKAEPARPCGLLQPGAATSGTPGCEGAVAAAMRPATTTQRPTAQQGDTRRDK